MDHGHFNCRDYYNPISSTHSDPIRHLTVTTSSESQKRSPFYRSPFARNESFDELEQRSRSPASLKPKFPLLNLPLELRQHIFKYLLPRTINDQLQQQQDQSRLQHSKSNSNEDSNNRHDNDLVMNRHGRDSSISKRQSSASTSDIFQAKKALPKTPPNVVWLRGNVSLLRVSRQVHDECADLLYGGNTFLLHITYSAITFRYSWLSPSGLVPNRRYKFLDLLSKKDISRIRRLVINIEHVDSYTSMIKFNVSGKGLAHGLRSQVQRLVNALQPPLDRSGTESTPPEQASGSTALENGRLARMDIRISNGNAFLDQVKSEVSRQRQATPRVSEDIQEMLQPFEQLYRVRDVAIGGAITDSLARSLEEKMKNTERSALPATLTRSMCDLDLADTYQLCCYGNDL